jgi:hypothetical protein
LLTSLKGVTTSLSHRSSTPRRAARSALTKWEVMSAVRQARRACYSHPATVRVCWDLDNTLANSGALVRAGKPLRDAIVETGPVPNMLEFYKAMQTGLPDAEHFILSARARSVRAETFKWLERYGVSSRDGAVCFVPFVEAKPKIWRHLARDTRLVIVDDLSYAHENDQPSIYEDLVKVARESAHIYIGLDEITQIAASSFALESVTSKVLEALAD